MEEAELETARALKRHRKAAMGAGRGVANRGSAAVSSATSHLSAEERTAIAAAYDEAEGWLTEMQRYFTDKLSEANLRNVMKQATLLATGEGVPHTKRSDRFRLGQPVRAVARHMPPMPQPFTSEWIPLPEPPCVTP